jgi:hypothetical protein
VSINPNENKQKAYLYFSQKNGVNAKNFAAGIRNNPQSKADVAMIWSHRFEGAYRDAAAVVIERGCMGEEKIAAAYRAHCPHCEIHYMTPDGDWEIAAEEEPAVTPPKGASKSREPEQTAEGEPEPSVPRDPDTTYGSPGEAEA